MTTELPAVKPLVVMAILVTALTLGVSALLYSQGLHAVRAPGGSPTGQGAESAATDSGQPVAQLLRKAQGWALSVTAGTAAIGAGVMLVVVMGFSWRCRAWLNRCGKEAQERDVRARQLEDVTRDLQVQIAERAKLDAELRSVHAEIERRVEERTSTLAKTYAQLEEELNERKQTEKALAQQAQELDRSKDVLELHVQARTQELQKLQRRYEHVLNSAGEGIYGLDLQGKHHLRQSRRRQADRAGRWRS